MFSTKFSGLFRWDIQSKKTSAKTSALKSHDSAQQNWRNFREKLHDEVLQGGPSPTLRTEIPVDKSGFSKHRPALNGGMDWWRMEWPFSRVRKIFFRARNLQVNPCNSRKSDFRQISGSEIWNFRARKNAIPYPQPFHTPTRLPPKTCLSCTVLFSLPDAPRMPKTKSKEAHLVWAF